jgi:hypothetical protein|tara:strand:- start:240 stop:890 length:651 start_codon:yes stop_codon:yes gene_type:complete
MGQIKRLGGIGTRGFGTNNTKNTEQVARFVDIFCYADDGMTDASYTISKGDAVVVEYLTGAGYQISVDGTATNVVSELGYFNVGRLLDAAGRNATGVQAGATGTAADIAFVAGIAAETVTIARDGFEKVTIQVYGLCEGVNVNGNVAVGERVVAETAAADASIGRLQDVDTLVGGSAQADIQELGEAAIVGIALTAASSNTATIWLLDPLGLASQG